MDSRIKQVIFNADEHKYYWNAKELSGVTKAIGKICDKEFPDTVRVQASVIYGHDVHSESENWIKEKRLPSTESGKWIVAFLESFQIQEDVAFYEAELLVSDFDSTASCIDIVAHKKNGKVVLFDIKTTSHFDRTYCSLQLSAYKRMFENCYGKQVEEMFVLSTKSRRKFRILEQEKEKVDRIFELNRKGF